VPIPSLAEIKEQIDANRRFQGPRGGLQITGGDVADAYWRFGRQEELIEHLEFPVRGLPGKRKPKETWTMGTWLNPHP
jgi:hypothetical protein